MKNKDLILPLFLLEPIGVSGATAYLCTFNKVASYKLTLKLISSTDSRLEGYCIRDLKANLQSLLKSKDFFMFSDDASSPSLRAIVYA